MLPLCYWLSVGAAPAGTPVPVGAAPGGGDVKIRPPTPGSLSSNSGWVRRLEGKRGPYVDNVGTFAMDPVYACAAGGQMVSLVQFLLVRNLCRRGGLLLWAETRLWDGAAVATMPPYPLSLQPPLPPHLPQG